MPSTKTSPPMDHPEKEESSMTQPSTTDLAATTATTTASENIKVAPVSSQDTDYVSEDEQLHDLEKSGAINNVVGSQSMLSQEIGGLTQEDHDDEDDGDDQGSASDFNPQTLLLSQDPHNVTTATDAVKQEEEEDSNTNTATTEKEGEDSQQKQKQELLEFTEKDSLEFLDFARAARTKAAENKPLKRRTSSIAESPEAAEAVAAAKASLANSQDSVATTTTTTSSHDDGSADVSASSTGKKKAKKKKSTVKDFGTLLTAVEIFTSQEDEQYEYEEQVSKLDILSQEALKNDPILSENILANHEGDQESQQCVYELLTSFSRSGGGQSQSLSQSSQHSYHSSSSNNNKALKAYESKRQAKPVSPQADAANRKRKRKDAQEKSKLQAMAQRAASLAQRTINDPDLAKRLLLSMALTRENPRSPPSELPGPGHIIAEGFFWAHYPPLEKVLKDNMAEYYELSITRCQSAQQQDFNNKLVQFVRGETNRQKWIFEKCFTDKCLRDRIRCYYKTHIQNAKKRLRTMVKNPTKRANARHLCAHLDIIEKHDPSKHTEKKQRTAAPGPPAAAAHPHQQQQQQQQQHPHPPPPPGFYVHYGHPPAQGGKDAKQHPAPYPYPHPHYPPPPGYHPHHHHHHHPPHSHLPPSAPTSNGATATSDTGKEQQQQQMASAPSPSKPTAQAPVTKQEPQTLPSQSSAKASPAPAAAAPTGQQQQQQQQQANNAPPSSNSRVAQTESTVQQQQQQQHMMPIAPKPAARVAI